MKLKTPRFAISLALLSLFSITACDTNPEKNEETELVNKELDEPEYFEILGERIDGPANVRDEANGKILFVLYDDELVEAAEPAGEWLEIGIFIALTEQQQIDFRLNPNTPIYDDFGREIGKTVDTVELMMAGSSGGFITGYTSRYNVKPHSVVERALFTEIKHGNTSLFSLEKFLWEFNFVEYDGHSDLKYKQLMIYESFIVDPSPRDRMTLLFDNDHQLVGIFHTRDLSLEPYKTYKIVDGHSFTVIADLSDSTVKRIIQKRRGFYDSVD